MTDMTTVDLAQCASNARAGGEGMRAANRKAQEAHGEWIKNALLAAGALYGARRELKHDATFGKWCEDNGCGFDLFSKDERAALVRIGSDVDYWREVLGKTESRSLRLIVQKEPPPEVSQAAIHARHQTKPGPKPKSDRSADAKADLAKVINAQYEKMNAFDREVWPDLTEAYAATISGRAAKILERRALTFLNGFEKDLLAKLRDNPVEALSEHRPREALLDFTEAELAERAKPEAAQPAAPATPKPSVRTPKPTIDLRVVTKALAPLFKELMGLKSSWTGPSQNRAAKVVDDIRGLLDGWNDPALTETLGPLFDKAKAETTKRMALICPPVVLDAVTDAKRHLDDWASNPGARIPGPKSEPPRDDGEAAPVARDDDDTPQPEGFLPGAAEALAQRVAELMEENWALKAKFETPSPGSVDIRLLVEKLQPMFAEIKEQSTRHVGLLDRATLLVVAGQGQRLLDQWSAGVDTVRRVGGHVRPEKMNAVAEALNAVVRDELRDALEEVSKLRAGYETMKEAYDKLRAERAAWDAGVRPPTVN